MVRVYHRKRQRVGNGVYQNLRRDGSIQSTTVKQVNTTTTYRSDGSTRQTFNSGQGWSEVNDSRSRGRVKQGDGNDLLISLIVLTIGFAFKLAWGILSGIARLAYRAFKR
ncbi:hypothetical protein AMJ98_PA00075 (plasmid) [Rhizobium sp. N1341]|nr:hypothetical protein AMJ98_PA00075 [Rhizobium sp. N1341]ANM42866.1 hypothetical protein AMK03_PA00075 [Rhizobium sp. N741]